MRRGFKIALFFFILAFAGVLFMFSPYFHISEIRVHGLENITEDEILERAAIGKTANMFAFNASETRRRILENLYIDSAVFTKEWPRTLNITIKERHLCGYVEYLHGEYLYIDENGRLLEINSYFTEKLPVVGGLKFTQIRLNEILEVDDQSAFKTVVTYARLLNKYELSDKVSRIEISTGGNTSILLYHLDFNVGGRANADEKVRTIKDIIENMPGAEIITGYVDMREISKQYFVKILL